MRSHYDTYVNVSDHLYTLMFDPHIHSQPKVRQSHVVECFMPMSKQTRIIKSSINYNSPTITGS